MSAATKGGSANQDKRKKSATKFDGYSHTSELEGYLITQDGNKPSQFRDLVDRLATYASREYTAKVGTSLKYMEAFNLKDFLPRPVKKSDYSVPKIDENGNTAVDSNGDIIYGEGVKHQAVKNGNIEIEYCPTEEMVADFFTKPLQGKLFRVHRNHVLGIDDKEYLACKDAYYKAKRVSGKQSVNFGGAIDPSGVPASVINNDGSKTSSSKGQPAQECVGVQT